MKRFAQCVLVCMGMSIAGIVLTEAPILQAALPLGMDTPADATVVFHTKAVATDTQTARAREDVCHQGAATVQRSGQAFPSGVLPAALVQLMGGTCITPGQRCRLPNPLPINSNCCCPNSSDCGYVGP